MVFITHSVFEIHIQGIYIISYSFFAIVKGLRGLDPDKKAKIAEQHFPEDSISRILVS